MNQKEMMKKLQQLSFTLVELNLFLDTHPDNREAREKTFSSGATDFITKPINPLEFFARVRVHLENRLLMMA